MGSERAGACRRRSSKPCPAYQGPFSGQHPGFQLEGAARGGRLTEGWARLLQHGAVSLTSTEKDEGCFTQTAPD